MRTIPMLLIVAATLIPTVPTLADTSPCSVSLNDLKAKLDLDAATHAATPSEAVKLAARTTQNNCGGPPPVVAQTVASPSVTCLGGVTASEVHFGTEQWFLTFGVLGVNYPYWLGNYGDTAYGPYTVPPYYSHTQLSSYDTSSYGYYADVYFAPGATSGLGDIFLGGNFMGPGWNCITAVNSAGEPCKVWGEAHFVAAFSMDAQQTATRSCT